MFAQMPKVVEFPQQDRDSGQFEALIRPHFPVLYNAARRVSATSGDAEDLIQDVCLKAYRCRQDLLGMEYPRAWLLRTLYNQFIDITRREQRSPLVSAESTCDEDTAELAGPGLLEPEKEVARWMNIEAIQRAMQRIGKEQGALLMMHDVDGLSLAEIHAATGLPLGTIKSKLHRARIKLGRLLIRDDSDSATRTQTGP
jgi:RNA polymerase sigma factor (sigma-70 family)